MNMGRVTSDRTMKKGTSLSDTPVKKRKLAHSSTGSSPGVVFTAVSFASPEKSDRGHTEGMNTVVRTKLGGTEDHEHQVHMGDGSTQEVDVTARNHASSTAGGMTCTLPTSMFIPHSPHQHQVEITSQRNLLSPPDNTGENSVSNDHESPSRLLSLQPRNGARGLVGGIDTETVPSLCSSTSGLQSESSPESDQNFEDSNNKVLDNSSLLSDSDERFQPKLSSSPMKIPITSPKPVRDELKTSSRTDRNVTFSPVPPVKYHYFDEANGRSHNKTSVESVVAASSVSGKAMTSGLGFPGIKQEEPQLLYKTDLEGDRHEEHKDKIRDGGITPTNFAFDYGKIELTSSFDDANALSWLQTPTGNMFSPGGLAVSTPLLNVLFFPEGPSHPSPRQSGPGDSRLSNGGLLKVENSSAHPFNSVICVSPLASTKTTSGAAVHAHKAQNSINSINFKEVFASPKIYQESMSSDATFHRSNVATDATQQKANTDLDFHIAERDIMEDEDLNLLRNLAQSTPKEISLEERSSHPSLKYSGKSSVFRGSPRSRDKLSSWKHPPSSLQMPLIHSESNKRASDATTVKYPPEIPLSHGKKSAQNSSRKGKKHDLPTSSTTNVNVVEPSMVPTQHGSSPGKPSVVPAGYYPPTYGHYHHPHHMGMPPPQYRFPYPPPPHPYGIFPNQVPTSMTSRGTLITEARTNKNETKRPAVERMNTNKSFKKSAPKMSVNANIQLVKKVKTASSQVNVTDRPKPAAVLSSIDTENSTKLDKAAALAAAIMRGVTMRPSGKWQSQLYYAGKSRYIGVFDTREKAALAYEIAREQLKTDRPIEAGSISLKETEANVNAARQAAFDGVNEADSKLGGGS